MKFDSIPITERSNPKSINIDVLGVEDIIKVLSDCEAEIFGGYEGYAGIYKKTLVQKYLLFASGIHQEIKNKGKVNLILIGSGTSGRLCRLMAKILNPIVGIEINIIPIIAGGIKALVRAEPNTEDKTEEGVADYLSYTANLDRSNCFVIGVTCGLSANYVKGALDEANKYSKGKTSIIGFNPLELATIELSKDIQVFNPIIGPEAIVGSVRMKGGTATMVLIYALLVSSVKPTRQIESELNNIFINCQDTLSCICSCQAIITNMICSGSQTLQAGGSIYLLGTSSYGALCIYDAAECPPTFGAKIQQVNGYSDQGITDLVYFPGEGVVSMAKEIDFGIFIKNTLPHLNKKDMVVAISNSDNVSKNMSALTNDIKLKLFYSIEITPNGVKSKINNKNIVFEKKWSDSFQKILFIRSLLVYISTGIFVLSGKVYENKMIDLRITNKKLFLRAVRIINDITNKDEAIIKEVLLRNIYEGEVPSDNLLKDHISLSATKENMVPLTILSLVYPGASIEKLRIMLKNEPIVRKLVIKEMVNLK